MRSCALTATNTVLMNFSIYSTKKCPSCMYSGIGCIKCDIATDEGSVYIYSVYMVLSYRSFSYNK